MSKPDTAYTIPISEERRVDLEEAAHEAGESPREFVDRAILVRARLDLGREVQSRLFEDATPGGTREDD